MPSREHPAATWECAKCGEVVPVDLPLGRPHDCAVKLGGAEGAHPTSGNENPDAPKDFAASTTRAIGSDGRTIHFDDLVRDGERVEVEGRPMIVYYDAGAPDWFVRDQPTARARDSGVQPLAKSVIRRAFARRHESPYMRHLARVAMSNARQMRDWRRRAAV